MSTAFPAFQAKVTLFWKWTTNKRAFVSAGKSRWQIYSLLSPVIPQLMLRNLVVELVPEFKYFGIWFTSVHANIFAWHYAIKVSKAWGVANAVFGLKHRIGSLPVQDGLALYKAWVDCYLRFTRVRGRGTNEPTSTSTPFDPTS
ncbi:hypothetical protein B0H19DRAFT_1060492 [Mycena capillaripes]|nr:hypothetical protein B0H19DRAFT_1060492 [Mycena capillaripes]